MAVKQRRNVWDIAGILECVWNITGILEYVWNAARIPLEYWNASGMPLEYVWNIATVYSIQEPTIHPSSIYKGDPHIQKLARTGLKI